MNHLLREGRGAAFHASPSHGVIEPFGEVKITLTSYNNLVGQYEDRFVCEVGSMRETIPIFLGVDGLPVRFTGAQLVQSRKEEGMSRVNFGTRTTVLANAYCSVYTLERASKVIQVENLSPRTITLKWKLYVKRQPPSTHDGRPNTATINADQIIIPENEMEFSSPNCPITVTPNPTTVGAFKTIQLRIHFSAALAGTYNVVLSSDVWYVQPSGALTLSPIVVDKVSVTGNGALPPRTPSTTTRVTLNPTASLANNPLCIPHPPGRQVQLLVLGKLVQPLLGLEDGADAVVVKRAATGSAESPSFHHRPDSSDEPFTMTSVALKNITDATCEFGLDVVPSTLRIVKADIASTPSAVVPPACLPSASVSIAGLGGSTMSSKHGLVPTSPRGRRMSGWEEPAEMLEVTRAEERSSAIELRREDRGPFKRTFELNPNDQIMVTLRCLKCDGKYLEEELGEQGKVVIEGCDAENREEKQSDGGEDRPKTAGHIILNYTNGSVQRIPVKFC
ncbi:hypothetical protein HDU97_004841 [Phlyctochytrium planicorne]|nr:hypothetical protein HDU97_004841 [Phlyctochytrium planicorne]